MLTDFINRHPVITAVIAVTVCELLEGICNAL